MYGIFTYIWLIFMVNVNVGKYTIHGSNGLWITYRTHFKHNQHMHFASLQTSLAYILSIPELLKTL